MGRARILQPADIDDVVDVSVGVDVFRPDLQRKDEDLAVLARRQDGAGQQASPSATPFSAIRA